MNKDATVEVVRFVRAMAGSNGTRGFEKIMAPTPHADLWGRLDIVLAFSYANFALAKAEELGWYPATFEKSDWWLSGSGSPSVQATKVAAEGLIASPARPQLEQEVESLRAQFAAFADHIQNIEVKASVGSDWGHMRYAILAMLSGLQSTARKMANGQPAYVPTYKLRAEKAEAEVARLLAEGATSSATPARSKD